ncbi:MAG TPA: hypothetical protein VIJ97_04795 [Candidatus Anoxymicrobiaceae bacterium]
MAKTIRNRKAGPGVYIVVILVFALITIAFTWPMVAHPATRVAGGSGDTLLSTYIMSWTAHAIRANPARLFNATMFFPNKYTLAYSDLQFSNSLISLPALLVTSSPIAAYTFVIFMGFMISAFGAFLLVYYLTKDAYAGVAGGIVFGFAMYKLMHLNHAGILATGFIPLAFVCLHKFTEGRRPLFAILFAVATIFVFWTSWEYGFFTAFGIGIYLVVLAIVKRRPLVDFVRGRANAQSRRRLVRSTGMLLASFVLIGVVLIPFALPYLKLQKADPSYKRSIAEVEKYAGDVQDFFTAPAANLLWGRATAGIRQDTIDRGWENVQSRPPAMEERTLFVGLIPLLLGIAGIVYLARKRKTSLEKVAFPFYTVLLVVALVMCLGPTLYVFGRHLNIPMPYQLLYRFFPGFKAIRTPTRMFVLVLMSLAVLAGFGIKWLRAKMRGKYSLRAATLTIVVVLALLTVEMMPFGITTIPVPGKTGFPAVYQWLGTVKGDAPTVVLPLPSSNEEYNGWEPWRIYYDIDSWKRIVNGNSGFAPATYKQALAVMNETPFPSKPSIDFLRGLKVKYVIVETAKILDGKAVVASAQAPGRGGPGLTLVKAFGDDYLFELK